VRAALERGVISDEQYDVVAVTGQAMERVASAQYPRRRLRQGLHARK
jgi:hypothetical protein